MRTVLFLVSGVLLLAAALILARLFSSNYPEAPRVATYLFLAAWLLLAGFNMWVGVARAGYFRRGGAANFPGDLRPACRGGDPHQVAPVLTRPR